MIELRVLGAFDLRTADGRPFDEALRRSKRIALLAFVAAARPLGYHRRDKLAALFWPDLDKERARGALRTTLSRLRDDLGDDVIESRGVEEVALRRDRLWCDVVALRQCLERGDALGAADLYHGPMFDGVHIPGTSQAFEQWISEERTAIRTGLLAAAATHVDRDIAAGQWQQAVTLAQRACGIAPDDESAARRLIRAALGAGDRGAALRAYEEVERVLAREYDVAPSEETTALIAPLRGTGDAPTNGPKGLGAVGPGLEPGPARTIAETGVQSRAARVRRYAPFAALLLVAVAVAWQIARVGMVPIHDVAEAGGSWRRFEVSAGVPPARHHGGIALDSSGDGLLAMGGARSVSDRTEDGINYRQTLEPIDTELWRLVGLRESAASQWVRLPIRPGPAPRPRWQYGGAYDPASDQWFVHGGALGHSAPCANDSWVLDRASGLSGRPAWRKILTRGDLPPRRAGFDLAFDKRRGKLIVFGGNDCINTYFHDTWVLSFDDSTNASGVWTRVIADSTEGQPVTRNAFAAVYDTASARLLVYGGRTPQATVSELWILDYADGSSGASRWHALSCAGEAPPLTSPAHAYDTFRDSWFFFGGADGFGIPRRELWRLDGVIRNPRSCRWTRITLGEPWPNARSSGAAVIIGGGAFLTYGGTVDRFSVSDTWVFRPLPRP